MKKVLLISNKVLHYRVKIYNHIHSKLREEGYEFILLTNSIQANSEENTEFKTQTEPFSFFKYKNRINEIDPDIVILFLHLKNLIMLPLIIYLKFRKIPVIYWNHGINQKDPRNLIKNLIYYKIHNMVDGILLYSPNEKKYIKQKNHKKVYVANNTIVFDEKLYPLKQSKNQIKEELDVIADFNILFVGRETKYKKLNAIIDIIKSYNNESIGLLIVGPLLNQDKTLKSISKYPQIKYLGEIYNKNDLARIYWISDVFCIPGANGLGLNEAMFWGLPCLTLEKELHGPEIWYLKNGENGYILNDLKELNDAILKLYKGKDLLKKLSKKSRDHILSKGHINNMYNGFKEIIKSITK
jgi:glycosyltransferase involved in cell wall biosynthesis